MGKIGFTEILVLPILIIFYFLPAYIAYRRKAADKTIITLLNFFTGWTGLGWLACLLWSLAGKKEFDPMLAYTPPQPVKQENFGQTAENLQRLKDLLDNGVITEDEFNTQKSRLLS